MNISEKDLAVCDGLSHLNKNLMLKLYLKIKIHFNTIIRILILI